MNPIRCHLALSDASARSGVGLKPREASPPWAPDGCCWWLVLVLLVLLVLLVVPEGAAAQRPRRSPSPQTLALMEAARGGGTDAEVDAAIDALRERADEAATGTLISLTQHRRVSARFRAYLALTRFRGPDARDAVSRGLSDPDESVRSLCARSLGEMGATETLPRLFRALERGVHDATRSIGALANAADLPRYHGYLGRVPLAAMLEGYAHVVDRPDLSWEVKQEVLHRLVEVSGPEVRRFLVQWQQALPRRAPGSFRVELERSIRRIPVDAAAPTRRSRTNATPGAPGAYPESSRAAP